MARLNDLHWEQIRTIWESDPFITYRDAADAAAAIGGFDPPTRNAISKRANRDGGWDKPPITSNMLAERERSMKTKPRDTKRRAGSKAFRRNGRSDHRRIPLEEKQKKLAGFVYIVMCDMVGERFYKIGFATDFQSRLTAIQNGCPLPVTPILVGLVNECKVVERKLHECFHDCRVSGEWFSFDDAEAENAVDMLVKEILLSGMNLLSKDSENSHG